MVIRNGVRNFLPMTSETATSKRSCYKMILVHLLKKALSVCVMKPPHVHRAY